MAPTVVLPLADLTTTCDALMEARMPDVKLKVVTVLKMVMVLMVPCARSRAGRRAEQRCRPAGSRLLINACQQRKPCPTAGAH